MKKIIFILILTVLSALTCVYADNIKQSPENQHLLSYNGYKNLKPENIKSLKIIRYTEGGANETFVDDKDNINQIYNFLNKIKISDESKMSCTDNTTVYSFTLQDNTKVSIEIECDWIVIKGKNYNFKI